MKEIQISRRLQSVAAFVQEGKRLADVGCDHGYIPIYLLQKKKIEKAIAMDINQGPLMRAKEHIQEWGLENYIDTRLSDGVKALKPNEVQSIVIAGMGGQLISEILSADIEKARKCNLVLQPMNAQYELRKYLISNGFSITDEDIAIEGFKVYNIMNVINKPQKEFDNDIEYHLPKYLVNHKYYKNLYDKKHREFVKVITGLENSKDVDEDKLNKYKYWLKELNKYES